MAHPPLQQSRPLNYGPVEIYYDKPLGVGSYGKVWMAKCGQLPCAAKLLHDTLFQDDNPGGTHNLAMRFQQECQFLSTISHPNVVQYLGTVQDRGRCALLMELMDESLTKFLERSTHPLAYGIQIGICHDIALALDYLHSRSIIHRDLSSNNILLLAGQRAKVTDFGMSKLIDTNPRMTPLTQVPGTPNYMPPEARRERMKYSHKLDCFSYGVLIVQIATGTFPNPGEETRIIDDPKYPMGFTLVPERERRAKDISKIEPHHPALPIALDCIKDRETDRPLASDLCQRMAPLRARYGESVTKEVRRDSTSTQLEQRLRQVDDENLRMNQELADSQVRALELQAELDSEKEKNRDTIRELSRKLASSQQALVRKQKELANLTAREREATEKLAERKSQLFEVRIRERDLREKLEREKQEMGREKQEMGRERVDLQQKIVRLEEGIQQLRKQVGDYETIISDFQVLDLYNRQGPTGNEGRQAERVSLTYMYIKHVILILKVA